MAAEPTERVTRRAADGKVYTRVLKQQSTDEWSELGEIVYHWCASESPEPVTVETPAHVCGIWRVSADQAEGADPETEAAAIAPTELTSAELIRRVLFTEEQLSTEPVPLLARAAVLALLKQAKALEDILVLLHDWRQSLDSPQPKKTYPESPDKQG